MSRQKMARRLPVNQRNADYWRQRFENLENSNNREARLLCREMESAVNRAEREINRQITSFHRRFARENNVSLVEARRLLNSDELKEFRWTVYEFIERGKAGNISEQWTRELNNASTRVRVTRLQALQMEVQNSLEHLFGNQLDALNRFGKQQVLKNYYRTIFEGQRGVGIAWDIARVDNARLKTLMNQPWVSDGRAFSTRITGNKERLIKELHRQLAQDFSAGRSPRQSIDAITKKFNTTRNHVGALVMTESAFFSSVAQSEAFDELEVDRFQVIATLDAKTSEVCQEMDLTIHEQRHREIGVNAPPFHVYCRSTTIPYFSDSTLRRWSRNPDGTKEIITGNISYKEWRARYAKE